MRRQAPRLAGDHELGNPEAGVGIADEPACVLIGLFLRMDQLEAEQIAIEEDRAIEVGDREAEMPDSAQHGHSSSRGFSPHSGFPHAGQALMRLPDTVISTSMRLRPPWPASDPTRCIARFDCIMINIVGWCQEDAMKITRAEAYLCDLAVERPRTDAIQAFI